jgi:hypothetical protein
MSRRAVIAMGLILCAGLCHADAPAPSDFAWRAPLQLPAATSMARVSLPAPALVQLQSSDARDIRVFNAAGEAVAFAFMASPKDQPAPMATTRSYPALPLYSAQPGNRQPKGSTQIRIQEPGGQRSVWVHMSGAEVTGAPRLNSILLATKEEQQTLSGLVVQATLPPNTPVAMSASISSDLAQWTPLIVRSRLYRFEGEGAPVNMTLEFDRPVKVEGRFLRLDWGNQEGVSVSAVSGVIATAAPARPRVRAELASPQAAGSGALEITTGFLTPLAGLALVSPRTNTLVPVRILGRNEASQPWRLLAQTVVYRLADAGGEAVNPPVALNGASARWLRLEASNGADLTGAQLQATAEFEPVQLLFLTTGEGPFQLAAGRAGTTPAALPLSTIASALESRKPEELPAATIGTATVTKPDAGPLARFWPGAAPGKTTVLWGVLLAGVLLLAGVAWSLLRQLRT